MSARHSRGHVFPCISSCLYVCLPIRYFYQSAEGSWDTGAGSLSLLHPMNQMQRDRGREGGGGSAAWKGVREQNLHLWYIWHLKWGFGGSPTLVYSIALQPYFFGNINDTLIWGQTSSKLVFLAAVISCCTARLKWTEETFLFKLSGLAIRQCELLSPWSVLNASDQMSDKLTTWGPRHTGAAEIWSLCCSQKGQPLWKGMVFMWDVLNEHMKLLGRNDYTTPHCMRMCY